MCDHQDYSQLTLDIFFFHDTATTVIYTLSYTTLFRSLQEAGGTQLGYERGVDDLFPGDAREAGRIERLEGVEQGVGDRKSTRLNSSHVSISYAVFCLKKKRPAEPVRRPRRVGHRVLER